MTGAICTGHRTTPHWSRVAPSVLVFSSRTNTKKEKTHLLALIHEGHKQWFRRHYQHLQIFLFNKSIQVKFRRSLILTWSWSCHSLSNTSSTSFAATSIVAICHDSSSSSNLFHSSPCLSRA